MRACSCSGLTLVLLLRAAAVGRRLPRGTLRSDDDGDDGDGGDDDDDGGGGGDGGDGGDSPGEHSGQPENSPVRESRALELETLPSGHRLKLPRALLQFCPLKSINILSNVISIKAVFSNNN